MRRVLYECFTFNSSADDDRDMLKNRPIDFLGAYGFLSMGIGVFMLPPCTLFFYNFKDTESSWRTPTLLLLVLSCILIVAGLMFVITWCMKGRTATCRSPTPSSNQNVQVFESTTPSPHTRTITVESKVV